MGRLLLLLPCCKRRPRLLAALLHTGLQKPSFVALSISFLRVFSLFSDRKPFPVSREVMSTASSIDDDVFAGDDWAAALGPVETKAGASQEPNDAPRDTRWGMRPPLKQPTIADRRETTESRIPSRQRGPVRSMTRTPSQLHLIVQKLLSPVLRSSRANQHNRSTGWGGIHSAKAPSESNGVPKSPRRVSETGTTRRHILQPTTRRPSAISSMHTSSPTVTENLPSRRDLTRTKQPTSNRRLSNGSTAHPKDTAECQKRTSRRRSIPTTEIEWKPDFSRTLDSKDSEIKRPTKVPASTSNTTMKDRTSSKALKEVRTIDAHLTNRVAKQSSRRRMSSGTATSVPRSPSPNKLDRSERGLTFAKTPSRRKLKEEEKPEGILKSSASRRRLIQTNPVPDERNASRTKLTKAVLPPNLDTDNRAVRKGLDERTSLANTSRKELIKMASQRRFSSSSGAVDALPRNPSRRALTKSPIAKDRNSKNITQRSIQKSPEIEWKPEFQETSWQPNPSIDSNPTKSAPKSAISSELAPRRSAKLPTKLKDASAPSSGKLFTKTENTFSGPTHAKSKRDPSRRALLNSSDQSVSSSMSRRSVMKEIGTSSRRNVIKQTQAAAAAAAALKSSDRKSDLVKEKSKRKVTKAGEKNMSRSASKKTVTSLTPRRSAVDQSPRAPKQRSVSPTEPTDSSDLDLDQSSVPLFRLTYKNLAFRSERKIVEEFGLDPVLNELHNSF